MAVMNVREMGVGMGQRLVSVLMIVRLAPVPLEIVLMLMMGVVTVAVGMPQARVGVLMGMSLGQMQPDAPAHQ